MQKHFYSHLVNVEEVILALQKLDLSQGEYLHLTTVIHSSMHTIVLDVVLSELPEQEKKQFLHRMHEDNHEAIWQFLHTKTTNIEEKILAAAQELKNEFLKDIKEAKK